MHIAHRCAHVYINIRQMKNAFSTKIGRVGEPKQGAGEEEHCSWRWSLPRFTTKASHSQQRVLSTVPFSSPGMIWLLVLEDSQSVCCAMLQGKLLLLVLIKYKFSESEWCWWCGAKAHSQLQNHNRKVEIKKKLGLFSFLWVAVQSAGNELTRGRAGGGRTVTLYAVCILVVVFKIFIFLIWLSFLVKCCCCFL